MADLSSIDRMPIEELLGMRSGYVLDFSNRTFRDFFFENVGVDIENEKHRSHGDSKAKRLRVFLAIETNEKVGKLLECLLAYWKRKKQMQGEDIGANEKYLYGECLSIASRLLGKEVQSESAAEDEFLKREFKDISLSKLNLNAAVTSVLEQRLEEIKKCLNSGAALAIIFLCGSTLEGILLGVAENNI